MSDISKILTDLLKATDAAKGAKQALNDMNNVKLSVDMDIKEIENINKLKKAISSLSKAQEELIELEKQKRTEIEATGNLSKETAEKMIKTNKIIETSSRVVLDTKRQEAKAIEENTRRYEEQRQAIVENWKQNTVQGKVFSAVTGKVAQFTAGITAGAMALRLLNRVSEAADTRNKIMIASFGELKDGFSEAVTSIWSYEAATRSAQATAIELGMANENVSEMMIRYNRIVGTDNPKALGALTEATLAMAKVMNISGSEAMSYVQTKMDQFGGSASSALQELDDLREATVKYNKTLIGTRTRSDDVLKVIQDITNSSTVYAADQRFLSQIMMRTSSTLQAQGESYNYAQRMAESYTKALSSEAPEWMQITNAFDITKEVKANVDKAGNLLPEFSKKLDAAKPGLAKKVQELLDAGYSEYDVTRLLGDTLKDTDLGMTLMSKKIVELGKGAGGISRLAAVYGKTHQEALALYQSAVKTQTIEDTKGKFKQKSLTLIDVEYSKMKDVLKLKDSDIELARKDEGFRESLINMYAEQISLGESQEAIEKRKLENSRLLKENEEEIRLAKLNVANLEKTGSQAAVEAAEINLKKLEERNDALKKQISGDAVGNDTILGALTNKVKDFQKMTGMFTGAWIKAKFEEYSGPVVLGVAAVAAVLWKGFGMQSRMEKWLEAIAENTAMKGGGGGGGYGGGGDGGVNDSMNDARTTKRRDALRKKRGFLGNAKRTSRRGLVNAARGIRNLGRGGITKGLMNAGKGLMGGAGGLFGAAKGLGKGLLKKIPGLGLAATLMDSGTAYAMGDSKGATKSLVGGGGAAVGTLIGGALGSIVPGAGTMIGGALGGMAGEAIANMLSDKFMNYDSVDSARSTLDAQPQQQNAQSIQGASQNSGGTTSTSAMGQASKTLDPSGNVTVTLPFMEWMAQGVQKANTGPFGG